MRQCHLNNTHFYYYYSTYGRDVPGQRFASLPRNQCEAVRHSGRLPSDRTKPWGSLELGIPAEVKARATRSFNAWCLVIFPGAFLHTKLCRNYYCIIIVIIITSAKEVMFSSAPISLFVCLFVRITKKTTQPVSTNSVGKVARELRKKWLDFADNPAHVTLG